MKKIITSKSVTEGHPDKICDKITDKILDIALEYDKNSKIAVECTIKDNPIFIYGEATTNANPDYQNIAKWVLKDIGYNNKFKVITQISEQSKEINNVVDKEEIGASNQGIMFGYANNETKKYMPLPSLLANKLTFQLAQVINSPLLPDGKSQVSVEYEEGKPKRINTIVIASQHKEYISLENLIKYIKEKVIDKVIPKEYIDEKTKILINTSGSFTIGGLFGDSGTTGRKIVVDSYGGSCKVGGGCFSSKDQTKVDRSAAHYTRCVDKNVVHYGLSDVCEIAVSYTIGLSKPVSINIETYNTNKIPLNKIYNFVEKTLISM